MLLLLLVSACLPEPLEVKGVPTIKPQIVVSSQYIPDQGLVVLLTKSFGALDASADSDPEELLDQLAINDALVILQSATSRDTLLLLERGIYGGITNPLEEEVRYELIIESPSMGNARAITTSKTQVTFDEIDAALYFNGFDDTLVQVNYAFTDIATKNYYMINVQRYREQELENNLLNPRIFTRLLDDKDFSETVYQESFRAFPRDYQPGDTVAIFLSNITDSYYRFMQLRQDNRFSFIEFISEPVNYPSNVEGGLGFFNIYIPDVRLFVLEDFE